MTNKVIAFIEGGLVMLTIHWQPLVGVISGVIASIYYLSMLKINVVDVKHNGSWKQYFKSFIKRKP